MTARIQSAVVDHSELNVAVAKQGHGGYARTRSLATTIRIRTVTLRWKLKVADVNTFLAALEALLGGTTTLVTTGHDVWADGTTSATVRVLGWGAPRRILQNWYTVDVTYRRETTA